MHFMDESVNIVFLNKKNLEGKIFIPRLGKNLYSR